MMAPDVYNSQTSRWSLKQWAVHWRQVSRSKMIEHVRLTRCLVDFRENWAHVLSDDNENGIDYIEFVRVTEFQNSTLTNRRTQMIQWYRHELATQPHLALMHSLYFCLPGDFDHNAHGTCRQSLSRGKLRYLVTERGKDPLGTVLTTTLYVVSFLAWMTPIRYNAKLDLRNLAKVTSTTRVVKKSSQV